MASRRGRRWKNQPHHVCVYLLVVFGSFHWEQCAFEIRFAFGTQGVSRKQTRECQTRWKGNGQRKRKRCKLCCAAGVSQLKANEIWQRRKKTLKTIPMIAVSSRSFFTVLRKTKLGDFMVAFNGDNYLNIFNTRVAATRRSIIFDVNEQFLVRSRSQRMQ